MAAYSSLGGSSSVTPSTNRIWKILKKRKAGDRKRQNGKQAALKEQEENSAMNKEADSNDESTEYGLSKGLKKMRHKIDMKI